MPIPGFRLHPFIARHGSRAALAALCLGPAILPAAAVDRAPPAAPAASPALQPADAADVAAPTCLLPGQIRSLGGLTLAMPRRPATLAPADCAARGGEPVADPDTPAAAP